MLMDIPTIYNMMLKNSPQEKCINIFKCSVKESMNRTENPLGPCGILCGSCPWGSALWCIAQTGSASTLPTAKLSGYLHAIKDLFDQLRSHDVDPHNDPEHGQRVG